MSKDKGTEKINLGFKEEIIGKLHTGPSSSSTSTRTPPPPPTASAKMLNHLHGDPFNKQIAMGSTTGWFMGFLLGRIGKPVAFITGTAIILAQVAEHNGYFNPNLTNIKEEATKRTNLSKNAPIMFNNIKLFANKNKVLAAGFAGGFLIGIATP